MQVFPVDENSAVCGFEAYINGKHVIGQLKLKEQAHTEYQKAIDEGHGAYLLDEGLFIWDVAYSPTRERKQILNQNWKCTQWSPRSH